MAEDAGGNKVQPDAGPGGLVGTETLGPELFGLRIIAYQDRTYRILLERKGARFISEKGWWSKAEALKAFEEVALSLGEAVVDGALRGYIVDRRFPGE